jgi:hypothetical protein
MGTCVYACLAAKPKKFTLYLLMVSYTCAVPPNMCAVPSYVLSCVQRTCCDVLPDMYAVPPHVLCCAVQ